MTLFFKLIFILIILVIHIGFFTGQLHFLAPTYAEYINLIFVLQGIILDFSHFILNVQFPIIILCLNSLNIFYHRREFTIELRKTQHSLKEWVYFSAAPLSLPKPQLLSSNLFNFICLYIYMKCLFDLKQIP